MAYRHSYDFSYSLMILDKGTLYRSLHAYSFGHSTFNIVVYIPMVYIQMVNAMHIHPSGHGHMDDRESWKDRNEDTAWVSFYFLR